MKKLSANQKLKQCEEIVSGFYIGPRIEFKPGIASYNPKYDVVRDSWLQKLTDDKF